MEPWYTIRELTTRIRNEPWIGTGRNAFASSSLGDAGPPAVPSISRARLASDAAPPVHAGAVLQLSLILFGTGSEREARQSRT